MNRTGVYIIRCKINDRVYVGSAALSFHSRWKQHRNKLRIGKHENKYLQRSWIKWGEDAFEFQIAEECDPEFCVIREQFWIDKMQAFNRAVGFNISPTAGSPRGCKHSEAARKAMSERRKGRKRSAAECAAISAGNLGRKRSKAECEAMSRAMKGRIISDEWRQKLSDAGKRRKHTEEEKRKIGDAHRGKTQTEEARRKVGDANRGRKHSKASREARSERLKHNLTEAQRAALVAGRLKRWSERQSATKMFGFMED